MQKTLMPENKNTETQKKFQTSILKISTKPLPKKNTLVSVGIGYGIPYNGMFISSKAE